MSEVKKPRRAEPQEIGRLQELVERANKGDTSVLNELRKWLDANPMLWRHFGDMAEHAQNSWIKLIAGTDHYWSEAVWREAHALYAEIAGPSPSPLEKLLAQRVVACWLQQHYADAAYAQAPKDVSPRVARFLEQRQSETQTSGTHRRAVVRDVRRPAQRTRSRRSPTCVMPRPVCLLHRTRKRPLAVCG